MTDDDLRALGKRAVACPAWRWMSGMREVWDGDVIVNVTDDVVYVHDAEKSRVEQYAPASMVDWFVPELRDPATLGCLLQLVRDAWEDPYVSTVHDWPDGAPRRWSVIADDEDVLRRVGCLPIGSGDTEAEALMAALKASPVRVGVDTNDDQVG